VVDIQKRALRSFEQNPFSALQRTMQIHHCVGHERPQFRAGQKVIAIHLRIIDRSGPNRLQDAVIFADSGLQLFREQPRLHQIGNSQPGSRRLITVGRPDPALGRADLRITFAQLPLFIERAMIWQNQMRAVADQQILLDPDPDFALSLDFMNQRDGIDDHTVSDHAYFSSAQNPGGNEMQNVRRPVVDDGVAGVVATLAPHHHVGLRREHIDYFAFAFIAPLGPDQNRVRHFVRLRQKFSRRIGKTQSGLPTDDMER
jgi:hypothetical protein